MTCQSRTNFNTIIKYSLKIILLSEFLKKITTDSYYRSRITINQLIDLYDNEFDLPQGILNPVLKKCYFNEFLYEEYFYTGTKKE